MDSEDTITAPAPLIDGTKHSKEVVNLEEEFWKEKMMNMKRQIKIYNTSKKQSMGMKSASLKSLQTTKLKNERKTKRNEKRSCLCRDDVEREREETEDIPRDHENDFVKFSARLKRYNNEI